MRLGPVRSWGVAMPRAFSEVLRLLQEKTRTLQGARSVVRWEVKLSEPEVGMSWLFRAVNRKEGGARVLTRPSIPGTRMFTVILLVVQMLQFSSRVVGWTWFTAFNVLARRVLVEKFSMVTPLGLTRSLLVRLRRQTSDLLVLVSVPLNILVLG